MILTIGFVHYFGLRPVSNARAWIVKLEDPINRSGQTESLQGLLRDAAEKDPWSAVLHEQWTDDIFRRWMNNPNQEHLENEAFQAVKDTVSLLPRSAGLRFRFAQRYTAVFEKTGKEQHRQNALKFYQDAIERYPNKAEFRASLALFLRQTAKDKQEHSEVSFQRNEALRLDDLMPHSEQKLSSEIRKQLMAF